MSAHFRASPDSSPARGGAAPVLIEFVPNKLYYTSVSALPKSTEDMLYFSIDNQLIYWNYCLDFGPLNIGHVFRFHDIVQDAFAQAARVGATTKVCLFSSTNGQRRANAVCLLGCWGILFHDMTAATAWTPFSDLRFPPFHDATDFECTYDLSIKNCLDGLEKAKANQYINTATFNVDEYQFYEKVENGDLSWVSPKFIAFAGPHNKFSNKNGQITLTPEHYVPYFKKMNVTLVVRLNDKCYDRNRFVSAGIDHLDLYYPDGTNAPMHILKQFIEASERTPGAVAVHCKAGLGRTGTCIGCYMMKHEQFTAREVIGWLRLCRPGSVIGPQQDFMEEVQDFMRSAVDLPTEEMEDKADVAAAHNSPLKHKSEGSIMTSMKKGALTLLMPGKTVGRPAPNKKMTINPQGDYLVAQKQSNSPPQSPVRSPPKSPLRIR
ncbi:hypothetical protein DYB32_000043 [Aphanomyces invadans]|uniref:protein-tyrosine-phosphatase n=1 Tax=Aphanomyces invadans TaxID=157072 RepID=A0A3R6VIW9_9STRA|nr:hypothetical protein DYB32_000043 [Aphanomyces invadans]